MIDFEAMTDQLFDTCEAMLGDTIQYKAVDADEFAAIKATVEYGEAPSVPVTGLVIDNEITVSILKSIVADRPTGAARLTLPKRPGKVFKPINIRDLGREWLCEVQSVG